MDSLTSLANKEVNYQAQVWNLESRRPSPIIMYAGTVNDVSSDWVLLYHVPEGTFIELQEIRVYNGDSGGAHSFRMAVVPPGGSVPSGSSSNVPDVYYAPDPVAAEASIKEEATLGLWPNWAIYGWSDAAAGEYVNVLLSGLVVSYLS